VAADGGGVETGIDAGEEDDEVLGDEIRDELVVCGEELGFGGFPGGGQCPIHKATLARNAVPICTPSAPRAKAATLPGYRPCRLLAVAQDLFRWDAMDETERRHFRVDEYGFYFLLLYNCCSDDVANKHQYSGTLIVFPFAVEPAQHKAS
jgi:hypothetical protein